MLHSLKKILVRLAKLLLPWHTTAVEDFIRAGLWEGLKRHIQFHPSAHPLVDLIISLYAGFCIGWLFASGVMHTWSEHKKKEAMFQALQTLHERGIGLVPRGPVL